MKVITFDHPHRRRHLDFFRQLEQSHFSICAPVDITAFRTWQQEHGYSFSLSIVYFLTKAALSVKQFRWRLRDEVVIEHKILRPSFTILVEQADVIAFCTSEFDPDFHRFLEIAAAAKARNEENPSMEDEPGKDDYLFMSSFPWVSFTNITHAIDVPAKDSVPRMSWGKFYQQANRLLMPLSVQAHHGLVDGRHAGEFFQALEAAFSSPAEFTA